MDQSTNPPILQDFVFGGIESDDARLLAHERARWQGIRHEQRIQPPDPEPGQPVTLTVSVGPDVRVARMAAYVTADGRQPTGSRGVASVGFAIPLHRVETRWETIIWDYVEVWQGVIPGQTEGTLVHYRIEGWAEERKQETGGQGEGGQGSRRTTDETNPQSPMSNTHWSREVSLDGRSSEATLYGYVVDRWSTPAWAREAIVYQVFVDRFARGAEGAAVANDWLEPAQMNEFLGDDLPGVTARLDHIADLGANTIWLTPIFLAASYHAYDTIDYTRIDPRFGVKADLAALVEKAHRLGLRVVLDFVANHTSDRSPPLPGRPGRRTFSLPPLVQL